MQTSGVNNIGKVMMASHAAFVKYRTTSLEDRRQLLYAIAAQMEGSRKELIALADAETHLGEEILHTEFNRTLFQSRSYGDACEAGNWLGLRIDTADEFRTPPKPDLRKTMIPLGPVVVFGASNFPFAYSTAGGDTACALAAGCSVVVRGHFAHAKTSAAVAAIIRKAVSDCGLPSDTFLHVADEGQEIGEALVKDFYTKAVGFTGSLAGGRALFDIAQQRGEPIPVFAEMGSTNPVFLLPEKLAANTELIAGQLASSITLSVGQFCTNPGILVGVKGEAFETFKRSLASRIAATTPAQMLHLGIAKHFRQNRKDALSVEGVEVLATNEPADISQSIPTLAIVPFHEFVLQPQLWEEVFGPYSLLVECQHADELTEVAYVLSGQLTGTIWATEKEIEEQWLLVDRLRERCGRLIFNGVPTGVDVAAAMHHGGPYPACTDSRFTAVGADGIKRFARPVSYQNWPDAALPPELRNANPLGIWRMVNNELTKATIPSQPLN